MVWFLVPLLLGFALNVASAFTTAFVRRWGERRGRQVTAVLRNVVGIPVWVVGIVLAARVDAPLLLRASGVREATAWILLLGGAALITWALVALRVRAAVPSTTDPLVAIGPYALVRHPIYAGMFLEFFGVALHRPTAPLLIACAIGIAWLFVQAKCEELDLVQRLPAYEHYMRHVGRFIPRRRVAGPD